MSEKGERLKSLNKLKKENKLIFFYEILKKILIRL
jgi:hypothetical protein